METIITYIVLALGLPPAECYLISEANDMQITQLIDEILRREGGLVNNPADRGGLTNFGITQRTWTEYRRRLGVRGRALPESVEHITEDDAREFYRREHIEPVAAWLRDEELITLIVDSAINHGPTRAARWMQLAAGVDPDGHIGPITKAAVNAKPSLVYREVLKTRFRFYAELASSDQSQVTFLRGWISRACEFVR